MGNITLTTKEYEELKYKAEMYGTLWTQIKHGFKVSYNKSSWRPIGITFDPEWTEEQQRELAYSIGLKVSRLGQEAFEKIFEDQSYVFDFITMNLDDMSYSGRLYKGQWDLRELSEEFANAYGQVEYEHEMALKEEKQTVEDEQEDEE